VAVSRARLRRAVRRQTIGVDIAAALNLTGALVKYLGLAPLFPAAIAVGYGESWWPFVLSAGIATGLGLALERATRGKENVGTREGFLIVALTWLLAAGVGALPYLLAGDEQLSHPVDALFEGMSGFTTTGASVLTDVEGLSRSLAMWRQFTQWLGGMGIIVLALAVLPRLRVGGRQLFETEAPGPEVEPLAASIRQTARRLWILYVLLTVVLALLLTLYGALGLDERMDVFRAVAHAFTTIPTAGFSTEARSLEGFTAVTQWTVILFMLLGGANFALMYSAFLLGRWRVLVRDEELRLYAALVSAATIVLATHLATERVLDDEAAFRHAAFQAVSLMTTTGYASADYTTWPVLAAVGLVGLMFIGGSAGSTAGSVKVVRHLLIGRILRRELDQTVHPEVVVPIRLNRVVVDERPVRAVIAFVLLYVGLFAVGTLSLVIDAARVELELSAFEAIAAAASALGNVGPAFGFAGPMGSYEPFSDVSKTIMIVLMWLGRLEIIPVVVLFTRRYWRA
jgi:trk system potassium uptake protein TrkH